MTEVSPTSAQFQVSLSAFQTWQRCEQRYFYSYVRHLRLPDQAPAPTLGRVLHNYLEAYYKSVSEGHYPDDAHLAAQLQTSQKFLPEIRGFVAAARLTGNERVERELNEIPAAAGRITDRYYLARGKSDADQYEFLHVEKKLYLQLTEGIYSSGVADLVTRDKATGRLNLWEHKSTQYIPQDTVRLRDFQTLLYAIKLQWQEQKIVIDTVIWNYMRTKEPTVPEPLKSGGITKRKDLDTTWEVYSKAVEGVGENPNSEKYEEMKAHLEPRELTIFFPRYERVTVVEDNVMMGDYIEESKRMKRARELWKAGKLKPIRTLARDCDNCEFYRICQTVLVGGDEEEIIKMRYIEG